MLVPGDTMKNGATVLAVKGRREEGAQVVLAMWTKSGRYKEYSAKAEFITWVVSDEGDAFWGTYCQDLLDAVEDFKGRR